MDKDLNLYERLLLVMNDISYIRKEDKRVNNQYTFVSHDAVTARTRSHFINHGVYVHPSVKSTSENGNKSTCIMDVTFVNVNNPEEKITVTSYGYGIDPQDKGPGKAMSYAFKYAILKALMLETGDDPERDSVEFVPDITALKKAAESAGVDPASILAYYKVDKFSQLTDEQRQEAFNKL